MKWGNSGRFLEQNEAGQIENGKSENHHVCFFFHLNNYFCCSIPSMFDSCDAENNRQLGQEDSAECSHSTGLSLTATKSKQQSLMMMKNLWKIANKYGTWASIHPSLWGRFCDACRNQKHLKFNADEYVQLALKLWVCSTQNFPNFFLSCILSWLPCDEWLSLGSVVLCPQSISLYGAHDATPRNSWNIEVLPLSVMGRRKDECWMKKEEIGSWNWMEMNERTTSTHKQLTRRPGTPSLSPFALTPSHAI